MLYGIGSAYQPMDMGFQDPNQAGMQYFQPMANPSSQKAGSFQASNSPYQGDMLSQKSILPDPSAIIPNRGPLNDPFNVNFHPAASQTMNGLYDNSWLNNNAINFQTSNPLYTGDYSGTGGWDLSGGQHTQSVNLSGNAINNAIGGYLNSLPGQGAWAQPDSNPGSAHQIFNSLYDPNQNSSTWDPFDAAKRAQAWAQGVTNFQGWGADNYNPMGDAQRSQIMNWIQQAYQNSLASAREQGIMGAYGNYSYGGQT